MYSINPLLASPELDLACDHCMKVKATKRCSVCKLIKYCSRECQANAWSIHKIWCCKYESSRESWLTPDDNQIPKFLHYVIRPCYNQFAAIQPDLLQEPIHTSIGEIFPEQIRELTRLPKPGLTSLFFEDEHGQQRYLTQEEHYRRFGTYFIEGNHVSKEDLVTYLKTTPKGNINNLFAHIQFHRYAIDSFNSKRKSLLVKKESPELGNGVMTLEPIKKGEIIGLVGGKRTIKRPENAKALMFNFSISEGVQLDQTLYTGWGRFINEGSNNCFIGSIWGDAHFPPETLAFVASRDIEAEEFLHFPYGGDHPIHMVKYFSPPNSFQEIAAFCQRNPDLFLAFKQIIQYKPPSSLLISGKFDVNNYLHQALLFEQIFTSPYNFFKLILNRILDLDSMMAFLREEEARLFIEERMCLFPAEQLLINLQNLSSMMGEPSLIQKLDQSLDNMTMFAWSFMINSVKKEFPITEKNLPDHLKKGQLVDRLLQFLLPSHFSNLDVKEEEGKEEDEEKPFECLDILKEYKKLPAPLNNLFDIKQIIDICAARDKPSEKNQEIVDLILSSINSIISNNSHRFI